MAVLSLPLSFTNSFWSQDYRRGAEVLFTKLEQGVAENDEIIAFITARASAEANLASSLLSPSPTGAQGTGFEKDDGASLLMAFRGLQAEAIAQGQVHKGVSQDLRNLVLDPFVDWAARYKGRLRECHSTVVDNWLKSYEQAQGDVAKLKHQYLSKTRKADEAEDDVKFAPNTAAADKFTASPRLRPHDAPRTPPQRTPSVSERIANRLKEIQRKSAAKEPEETPEVMFEGGADGDTPTKDEEFVPSKVDKGKGKAIDPELPSPPPMAVPLPPSRLEIPIPGSPMPPMPASPMLLAGLSLPPSAISSLLTRAAAELPLRPVRFPLLGEYPDCFTGEEFVTWLNENVQGFGGSLDRAEDAARDLTERDGLLRRIGEFGNQFETADDAFYQFRPKAFDIERAPESVSSPIAKMQPVTENLFKRSNNFVNLVTKAVNSNVKALNSNPAEPAYLKARMEAEAADKEYRVAVRRLDRQRLGLEERIEDTLKTLQRWETERLRAIKTVLLQYQGTVASLTKSFEPSFERSTTLIAAYQPESDVTALIERYRTGPFRPTAEVYESVAHDESDVVFGIDLRKWAEGGWSTVATDQPKRDSIPVVVTALLDGMTKAYEKLTDDTEKRKAWIYEVPLPSVHHLREALNGVDPDKPFPADLLTQYEAPIIASVLKLWALELDPPLALYEGWDEFRKLYPGVGSSAKLEGEQAEEQHSQDLQTTLQRLPRVHLFVLDAIVSHLRTLIDSTTVEEADEVYITKLALSVGRTIIRPKIETQLSIQDRHPTLLFIDLVKNYSTILPPTIARKKRESERKVPLRKRTAPIDMRLSRSRMSIGSDPRQMWVGQQAAQNPSLGMASSPPPPVPPLPKGLEVPAAPVVERSESPEPEPEVEAEAEDESSEEESGSEEDSSAASTAPPTPAPATSAALPAATIVERSESSESKVEAEAEDESSEEESGSEEDSSAASTAPPTPAPAASVALPPPPPTFVAPGPPPPFVAPGPPPPISLNEKSRSSDSDLPPRPSFKQPPREDDDLPPRPSFKEPPREDEDLPPRPKFADPTSDDEGTTTTAQPTPRAIKRTSIPPASASPSRLSFTSRSPSPGSTLSRAGSGSAGAGGPIVPRRGPRAPGGGSVSSMVSNFNRNAGSPPPPPSPGVGNVRRLSSQMGARPLSTSGRVHGRFSSRTMASDAEDEVIGK